MICIVCPKGCHLQVEKKTLKVSGNSCPRGEEYGRNEIKNPVRVVTSTVRLYSVSNERLPVKTDKPIPKHLMLQAVRLLDKETVNAPIETGNIVLKDILGTGSNFVATRTVGK